MKSEHSPPESSVPKQLLTGDNCLSSTRIRAFLRLSRIATDDTIRPHLNEVKKADCNSYFQRKIVPQWKSRQEAIIFCKDYTENLRKEVEKGNKIIAGEEPPEFDLRTDPYALKAYQQSMQEKFVQIEAIDNWVKNEETVETIIREQTVNVLNEKCEYRDWMKAFSDSVNNRA